MTEPGFVFVTSEDDRYRVKGGIGTAIGVLTDALEKHHPHRPVDWITESPDERTFLVREGSIVRHYLSRRDSGATLPLNRFASKVDDYLGALVRERLQETGDTGLIVEAADWEGLAWRTFQELRSPHVLKVSRLHTPLALCAEVNELELTVENHRQMDREREQLLASDLLSAPTEFVLANTLARVLEGSPAVPPSVVIPNCANVAGFKPSLNGRRAALELLRRGPGIDLPESAFKIFVLGSLEIRKGVRIIQEAIPKIFEGIPDCHLAWVGHYAASGELTANSKLDRETFYAGIPETCHHRAHLAGYVDHGELPHIFPAADLFAVCYLADNFPGVVLEIALAEKPLVALLRGGIPEMILDGDRPLALILDDSRPEAPADQLLQAALQHHSDPSRAASLAGRLRGHVIRRFGPETVTTRILASYDERLERKRKAAGPWLQQRRFV